MFERDSKCWWIPDAQLKFLPESLEIQEYFMTSLKSETGAHLKFLPEGLELHEYFMTSLKSETGAHLKFLPEGLELEKYSLKGMKTETRDTRTKVLLGKLQPLE